LTLGNEEMVPIVKKYKIAYGKLRRVGLFAHLSLKAIEYIEAESLTKAIEEARATATALGYEVDMIKEVNRTCCYEINPTIQALTINAYLRGKAEGKLESLDTHVERRPET